MQTLRITSVLFLGLIGFGCKAKSPTIDDASISVALQTRLHSDPGLTDQPVQGIVVDRVVTLSGRVTSEAARSLAANDAAEVAGVRTVVNNLEVLATGATPAITAVPLSQPAAPSLSRLTPVQRQPRRSGSSLSEPAISAAPIDRRSANESQYGESPSPAQATRSPAPTTPVMRNISVPAGTGLSVRVTQTLDSSSTQPGSSFTGVLASDVIVDGLVAIPSGTRVNGHVDDAKDAGHFSGSSLLAISLNGFSRRGENIPISTDTVTKEGKGRGKNTAEKIGGGAAVGAILGGIFGGGKGAAIGAGAGGGLGAGANGVTRGEQVQIESESIIRFRLSSAVTVRASTQMEDGNRNSDLRRRDQ